MRDGEMKGKSGGVMSELRAMGCGFKCLNERKTEKVILRKVRKRDMNLKLATPSSFIFLTPSICQHFIFLSLCNQFHHCGAIPTERVFNNRRTFLSLPLKFGVKIRSHAAGLWKVAKWQVCDVVTHGLSENPNKNKLIPHISSVLSSV